ncbi:MAG: site-2 protease family protein, partial [Coriobacteriia bacterium]|nr:site-2 protease family protein [Coriobacteriia bacterium]
VRLGPVDALRGAQSYAGQTGAALLTLFMQQTSAQTMGEVSGIVGVVSVMGQAAQQGGWAVLTLVAALSLSLGWMNLLPLPPMDGGKFAIEIVQKIIGRPISLRVQGIISMATMAAFTMLFFVLLFNDTARLVGGGF